MNTTTIIENILNPNALKEYKKDIYKKYKVILPVDILSNIMFDNTKTTTLINYSNSYLTVCHIPLITLSPLNALDKIFFHETRHVIEIEKLCGIEEIFGKNRLTNFEKYLEIIYNSTNSQEISHINKELKGMVKKLNNK